MNIKVMNMNNNGSISMKNSMQSLTVFKMNGGMRVKIGVWKIFSEFETVFKEKDGKVKLFTKGRYYKEMQLLRDIYNESKNGTTVLRGTMVREFREQEKEEKKASYVDDGVSEIMNGGKVILGGLR